VPQADDLTFDGQLCPVEFSPPTPWNPIFFFFSPPTILRQVWFAVTGTVL
jgi:hypothetical protein